MSREEVLEGLARVYRSAMHVYHHGSSSQSVDALREAREALAQIAAIRGAEGWA